MSWSLAGRESDTLNQGVLTSIAAFSSMTGIAEPMMPLSMLGAQVVPGVGSAVYREQAR